MNRAFARAACAAGVFLFGAASALAGPTAPQSKPDPFRYDISFQDGRTQSQIGHGLVDARGIVQGGDPEDLGPTAFCFDRDNPPPQDVIDRINAIERGTYDSRYQIGGSWTGNGLPVHLTWSFAPDGLSIPGGAGEATANNILFQRMDALFAGVGGRAAWIAQFQLCFDRWAAISGVSYTHVTDGTNDWDDGAAWGTSGGATRGDVRISMHNIDNVNGILAYNNFPTTSDMVIDSSENWAQGSPGFLFLRNVVRHEHGHGLGFAHVCPSNQTKLMEPFVSTAYDGPQQDDIRAVAFNYGDAYEPNNTVATAYDLGTLPPGSNTTLGNLPSPAVSNATDLAISSVGDSDYFKITLADPALVSMTATPIGTNYAQYAQDSACNNGAVNDNALAAADLVITAYNANGSTVLRTQNATAAGSAETISGLLFASGPNYIKVSAASASEVQLYRLTITVGTTNLTPTASDGAFSDHVHITWPAISDATSYQVYRNATNAQFGGTTLATVSPPTLSYDDTTMSPGTQYYYFVKAQQPGNTGYRFTTDSGNTGFADAPPTANAGPDQTLTDTDNSGSESVTLDGSASTHVGPGVISVYRWNEGATILSQGSSPTAVVPLPVGVHTITLTVTDTYGFQGADTVIITINPPGSHCGSADFNCDGDVGTDADIEAFFTCIAGNCPALPCTSNADFNGDGDVGTDADIEAFFRVLSGGTC